MLEVLTMDDFFEDNDLYTGPKLTSVMIESSQKDLGYLPVASSRPQVLCILSKIRSELLSGEF